MLEFLISSASRRKTLVYLLNNQDKEFHLRELSRNIGEPAPMIKRELDRLEQIGFVLSWAEGNRRHFKVNRNFLLLPELKSLADKSIDASSNLKVANTFILEDTLRKRKDWENRSKEIGKKYGNGIDRQRPRHPAEARMLEKI
jgi:predicted transcriptional regulator